MKVTLDGEQFDFDGAKFAMSEALAIEKVYQRRFVEWQADLQAGSVRAMAVLAWLIWRRDGRQVTFEDIESGAVDFDLMEFLTSVIESAEAQKKAQEAAEEEAAAGENPTPPGQGPDGTGTTATPTSARSPKRSATPPPRSTS